MLPVAHSPAGMQWRYAHTVLSACALAYFAVRFAQLLVSPLVPELVGAFGVTRSAVGGALTAMWVAYALSQLPSGLLGDRYGERPVVLAALALTAVASVALAGAPSFPAFVAAITLLGAGAGLFYNVAVVLLAGEFDEIGRAIGGYRAGAQLAGLVAPVAATAAVVRAGWRVALLAGVVPALVALVAFVARIRPAAGDRTGEPDRADRALPGARALLGTLSRPRIAATTLLATLGEFALVATTSFLPAFLVEHHGLALPVAGGLFSAYFASVALGQPAVGWLSDRTRDGAIAAAMVAGAAGYGALAAGRTFAAAVPGVLLVGVGMSWGPPVQSRALDALDDDEQGLGFGLVRTCYILLGALGGVAVGTVAERAGWSVAFWLLSGISLCALGTVIAVTVLGRGAGDAGTLR
ncbi:MAG: MFS transporter [Haloarculaceae archaeon]